MNRLVLPLSLWLCACASASRPATATPQPARAEPAAFQSPLDRDHPLVGHIWDVERARFIAPQALTDQAASARFLLLGEKHDNADHHALQARILDALVARGRKPAVVFEMLDTGDQAAIDRVRSERPDDVDAIAEAVDWQRSGWPPFRLYRPVFAVAVRAGLPIVAAGIDREQSMQLARKGPGALDAEHAQRFALHEPLEPELHAALRAEMRDAHCGLLPEAMLDAMVLIQRVRDARLSERMHAAAALADGAVLITGNGHARADRGVPAMLARVFGAPAFSLAMHEVRAGWTRPQAYAAAWDSAGLPFDAVWFTPRSTDEDPCESLRQRVTQ